MSKANTLTPGQRLDQVIAPLLAERETLEAAIAREEAKIAEAQAMLAKCHQALAALTGQMASKARAAAEDDAVLMALFNPPASLRGVVPDVSQPPTPEALPSERAAALQAEIDAAADADAQTESALEQIQEISAIAQAASESDPEASADPDAAGNSATAPAEQPAADQATQAVEVDQPSTTDLDEAAAGGGAFSQEALDALLAKAMG